MSGQAIDRHYSRCAKHQMVPPHNFAARSSPETDTNDTECGACIMADVHALWNGPMMDLLDTIANLLKHHAMLRTRLNQLEGQMALMTGSKYGPS